MSNAALLYEVDGHVAWLTLNRPEAMNSINLEMVGIYEKILPEITKDDAIRAVVITGKGKAFCAGADLREVLETGSLPAGKPDFLDRVYAVLNTIRDMPKPVIAALNGITMAGGLETALCADIVLAADTARIGDGHANYGVYPGAGGAALLPRVIPHNVAKYLLFTGRMLGAKDLHDYGLVNEVVPAGELGARAQELAEEIAAKSPLALARMKEVANASVGKSRAAALEHEQVMLRKHLRSWDMQEGLKAFAEKRKPRFKGI
jgi:enoyl-CoA hydratase/carnithine racemase